MHMPPIYHEADAFLTAARRWYETLLRLLWKHYGSGRRPGTFHELFDDAKNVPVGHVALLKTSWKVHGKQPERLPELPKTRDPTDVVLDGYVPQRSQGTVQAADLGGAADPLAVFADLAPGASGMRAELLDSSNPTWGCRFVGPGMTMTCSIPDENTDFRGAQGALAKFIAALEHFEGSASSNDEWVRTIAWLLGCLDPGLLALPEGMERWGGPFRDEPPMEIEGRSGWREELIDNDNSPARHFIAWFATGYFHPWLADEGLEIQEAPVEGRPGSSQQGIRSGRIAIDIGRDLRRGNLSREEAIRRIEAALSDPDYGGEVQDPEPTESPFLCSLPGFTPCGVARCSHSQRCLRCSQVVAASTRHHLTSSSVRPLETVERWRCGSSRAFRATCGSCR
jgi:hypothetical protein